MSMLELGLIALSAFLSILLHCLYTRLGSEEVRNSSLEKQVVVFSDTCNSLRYQLDTQIIERTNQVAFEQRAHQEALAKLKYAYANNEAMARKLGKIQAVFANVEAEDALGR
jgi:hypothetical protein